MRLLAKALMSPPPALFGRSAEPSQAELIKVEVVAAAAGVEVFIVVPVFDFSAMGLLWYKVILGLPEL